MKIIVFFSVFMLSLNLYSQDEITEYGPRAGNYGVGIAANPFFQYMGNFFGKAHVNTAPAADLASSYHLFGKYFTSNNTAIRAGLHLNYDIESTFFGTDDENKFNETGKKSSNIQIGFNDTPAQLAPCGTIYFSLYF